MKTIQLLSFFAAFLILVSCGDDSPSTEFQSQRCSSGQQATLTLNIDGVGNFTYMESSNAISHASDTDGSFIDALSMYIRWEDLSTGDSIYFDVTVENETIAVDTFNSDPVDFNGTVNFYIYSGGTEEHYTYNNWQTIINDFEVYETSTNGGLTNTRYAFMNASTSGSLRKVGAGTNHTFTSSYTICPKY